MGGIFHNIFPADEKVAIKIILKRSISNKDILKRYYIEKQFPEN